MNDNSSESRYDQTTTEQSLATTEFKEALPPNCPPDGAKNPVPQVVLRLVSNQDVTEEDFFSYAKLGKKPHFDVCPCLLASCSVFSSSSGGHRIGAHIKLPKLRGRKYVAKVKLTPQSGLVQYANSNSGHIDLWMFSTFNPLENVLEVLDAKSL